MTKSEIVQLIEEKVQKVDCSTSFPSSVDARIWTTTVA